MTSQSLRNDSDGSLVDDDVGRDVSSYDRGHVILHVVDFGLCVVHSVVHSVDAILDNGVALPWIGQGSDNCFGVRYGGRQATDKRFCARIIIL